MEEILTKAKTHFVRWMEPELGDAASESNGSESCWVMVHMSGDDSDNEEVCAYPVCRTQKEGTHKKSEVFDGVYPMMGRDAWEAMKKEQRQRYELWRDRQYAPVSRSQPPKTSNELPTLRKSNPTLPPKPTVPEGREFKIAKPRKINESGGQREYTFKMREKLMPVPNIEEEVWYDAQDVVIIMEDDTLTKRKTKELVRKLGKDDTKDTPKERTKNLLMESAQSEILGVFKELARLLAESIKPPMSRKDVHLVYDSVKKNKSEAEGFWITGIAKARMKEASIEFPIRIHGNSLKVVIDTRSQLNIVSEQMYEKFIKLLINQSKTLVLHDTNGGKGLLKGLISQVPISIESVLTIAEIYNLGIARIEDRLKKEDITDLRRKLPQASPASSPSILTLTPPNSLAHFISKIESIGDVNTGLADEWVELPKVHFANGTNAYTVKATDNEDDDADVLDDDALASDNESNSSDCSSFAAEDEDNTTISKHTTAMEQLAHLAHDLANPLSHRIMPKLVPALKFSCTLETLEEQDESMDFVPSLLPTNSNMTHYLSVVTMTVHLSSVLLEPASTCPMRWLRREHASFNSTETFQLADTIDDLLTLSLPDEDTIHKLLQNYSLDDLCGTGVMANTSLNYLLHITESQHELCFNMKREDRNQSDKPMSPQMQNLETMQLSYGLYVQASDTLEEYKDFGQGSAESYDSATIEESDENMVTIWTDSITDHFEPGDSIWTMTLDGHENEGMFWTPDNPFKYPLASSENANSFTMYKQVDKKVHPVPGVFPQEAQVVR
ncbi:uncharacterized protein F5147DRAFT_651167 [Suillus discolor]|uniref:Uncharacterized protein n=1 Tax=Suillus discolor TaxID=1912936 RepID=A0A9P7FBR8_9AGAM|nr:uncharacterized protein F5147DRAFT_651167 [Suillus discolor]KAG2112069.1 hypothetical protein F5147DRAFT_651167 [Suillus discolor]